MTKPSNFKITSVEVIKHEYEYSTFNDAKTLEDILCLSTLVAVGKIVPAKFEIPQVSEAKKHFESIDEDCDDCPYKKVCLAVIINE